MWLTGQGKPGGEDLTHSGSYHPKSLSEALYSADYFLAQNSALVSMAAELGPSSPAGQSRPPESAPSCPGLLVMSWV